MSVLRVQFFRSQRPVRKHNEHKVNQLKQHFTARLPGVSEARLSLIMNGKQKPGIYFVKALHDKLNLDGNQILQAV